MNMDRSAFIVVSLICTTATAVAQQSRVEKWGGSAAQYTVPPLPPGTEYVEAHVGVVKFIIEPPGIAPHGIALRDDGEVVVFGDNSVGQGNVPPLPPGMRYVEVDAGPAFCVARRSDGNVFAWGASMWNPLTPPAPPPGVTYVEIAAGQTTIVARRSDGLLVGWGGGEPAFTPPPPGVSYTRIDAGAGHVIAMLSDGRIRAWGYNANGQTNVPPLPPGVTYVDMSAGMYHNLALRSDGQVVAWGSNFFGNLNVPPFAPGAVNKVIAGPTYSAVRLADGTLSVWGTVSGGYANVPALGVGERFTQLSAGEGFFLAIVRSGVEFYGEARPNSLGCLPTMSASGTPSATQSSGFTLRCDNVRNQAFGLLMYTVNGARASTPFQCGTRLLGPAAILRTTILAAGGSPASVNDCTGVFQRDMNTFAAGVGGGSPSPLLGLPGTLVHAQWWGRDNGYAPPCNTMLSNAAEYVVLP
ncbi:MAG: hypothetical protein JNN27_23415 [Planctomycetes bacterium]|nr:hypothetical protein [Planctomycetota bacterium]